MQVVGGHRLAAAVAAAGVDVPHLVWGDALHDGPVPDEPDAALASRRAGHIAAVTGAGPEVVAARLTRRDARLDDALRGQAEIVLWFEADLHDQLQRLQVLARIARTPGRAAPARVSEAFATGPAGGAEPAPAAQAFACRRRLDAAAIDFGESAWRAFTSADPTGFERLLDADLDAVGAPRLARAIKRWREEFPAVRDGLSRTERQTLEALSRGLFRCRDLQSSVCRHGEQDVFIDEAVYASILCRLSRGPRPLLAHPDQRPVELPDPGRAAEQAWRVFWNDSLLITRAGRRVLAGDGDWMQDAPPRWLGGVCLNGVRGWRWDGAANRLRCSGAARDCDDPGSIASH